MHERRKPISLDLESCVPGLLRGGAVQNNLETQRKMHELEGEHARIVGEPRTRSSGKGFGMAVFQDGFGARQASLISLGLASLFLLISVTFSPASTSENDNASESMVLAGRVLKTIIVPDYYPYTFVNDKGMPDGFSVDVAKAVAQSMDLKLEIRVDTWEHAVEALKNGTIDFLPMMAFSPVRKESFDFSAPLTIAYDAVFVRKGVQRITSLNDLAGKSLIVLNRAQAHDFILTNPVSNKIKLILVDSLPDGLRMLASGKGDAALMPKLVGLLLVKKLGIQNVDESPGTIEAYSRPFCFAVKKGNSALLERLSQGLSIVKADGRYRAIYGRWFGVLAPTGLPWELVLKYILGIMAASALIGVALVAWSLSLKRQVKQRTEILESEISTRKKTEDALRASEERYRGVFENAANGIDVVDSNGRFIQVNSSLAEMLGYTQDELTNLTFIDISHPDDAEVSRISHEKMVRGETESYRFAKRYIRKNGEVLWADVSVSPVRGPDGSHVANVGVIADITERKRAEEAILASEEKYRTLFEESFDGLFITSLGGKILDMNKKGVAMFGYDTKEEILSLDLEHDVYAHPPDRKRILAMVNAQGSAEYEVVVKKKNGEEMITHCSLTAVRDEKDVITSYRGIIRDITERKKAEEALRTSEAQLSNAVMMAHLGPWEYDVTKDLFTFNDHFYKLFRTTAERVGGYTMSSAEYARRFVHPDDVSVVGNEIRKSIEATNPDYSQQLEHRIVYADGEIGHISVRIFLVKDELGRTVRTYGVNQDVTERKRAEIALQEAISYNRSLIEASLDPLVTISAEGKITDVNGATERVTGYSRDKLIGTDFADYFTDSQKAKEGYQRAFREGVVKDYELQICHRDGDLTAVMYNASVFRERSGEIAGLFAVARDITERKISEELIHIRLSLLEFAASHPLDELLQKTLDEIGALTNSSIGFYHFVESDQKTLFLQAWSTRTVKEFCKAGGKGQHYSIDRAGVWVDCIHKRKPVIHNDYSSLPHRKGMPEGHAAVIRELVVPIMRSDRVVAVLGIGNKTTDYTEKDIEIVSYLADVAWEITTRKRTEEALKESEQQYRALFEDSIDGVYSVLRDGTITDANTAFCGLFGYTTAEMIGKDIRELYLDPADRAKFQNEIEKNGFVKDYEIKFQKRNGTEVDCLISSSVHFGKDGGITGYRGILRDLTARKALQRQLVQAQKMEAIGTLAGGIAHDFNNLLQVVLGYSELVLADEGLPDHLRSDLGRVLLAGKNGSDLVQRLLTFSRKSETKPLNLDLNQRIRQTEKFLQRTIPKMIDIELILADDLDRIHADPIQMDQVLMNLAVNAKDAMPDGGKLTIETSNVFLDEEYTRAHLGAKPGEYVLLSVTDTGRGINRETLSHIFEPFFTTKEAGKGTGLGLAMVYGIVKQHSGYITCYSEPDEGTTFKIYFPAIEMEMNLDVATTGIMPAFGTETILLVDDEELVRDLGKRILERSGYTVLTAANGKKALDLYKRERDKISLVILDLIMPEMGGKQCLEELLRIDPKARVLIASGFAADGQTRKAVEIGARGFVDKPYNMKGMLKAVREVLDQG
jgi:two-component system, cell cycle sensor histidine kinase and response regulator CckA